MAHSHNPSRRDVMAWAASALAAAAPLLSCSRDPVPAPKPGASGTPAAVPQAQSTSAATPAPHSGPPERDPSVPPEATAWHRLDFPPSPEYDRRQQAMIMQPKGRVGGPLLVLLHGRGETRSLGIGARAWRDDYHLGQADDALRAAPLGRGAFEGFIRRKRLRTLNAQLAETPYQGVRVVCPYTPDLIRAEADEVGPYADFVTKTLIPRAAAYTGGPAQPPQTAIDGVSLGGRVALLVGLTRPDVFGAVGAMQPAIQRSETPQLVELVRAAREVRPQRLRLITSEDDPFREAVEAFGFQLRRAKIPCETRVTPGPHDYAWNRGPGAVGTLAWYDRVLRDPA